MLHSVLLQVTVKIDFLSEGTLPVTMCHVVIAMHILPDVCKHGSLYPDRTPSLPLCFVCLQQLFFVTSHALPACSMLTVTWYALFSLQQFVSDCRNDWQMI